MDFWDVFWLLLIYIPLVLVWVFALVDIFRRDELSGAWKATWVLIVVVLPFLGTLIYLMSRPAGPAGQAATTGGGGAPAASPPPSNRTEELRVLSELHDRGKLTDDEFAAEKARIVGRPGGTSPGLGPS